MSKFDEATLRELSWDNLKAVARENGVRMGQKRVNITKDLLQLQRPKMTQLAKLLGDKGTLKMEKIRRRTVGHVKTPPRPAASGRRTRSSTARRASEPQPQPEPESATQPQSQTVDAPAHGPASTAEASAAEGRVEAAKPKEELRPLERARALCRAEKEKRAKEEAARTAREAETQPPSTTYPGATAPGEPDVGEGATVPTHLHVDTNEKENTPSESAAGKSDGDDKHHSEQTKFQFQFPRKRVLYPVGVPVPPDSPPKPRARTPGLPRDQWPDEWLVGLLSPDPSNPRPVFSPPVKKPCNEPKEKEEAALPCDRPAEVEAQPPAPAAEKEMVGRASVAGEKEQVDGEDTDTELAEEDEVFEMTSMDNIRVTLPEDDVQHHVDLVYGANKIVRENKRKAEDDEEEEKTVNALERSPAKRRRTGLPRWLSKVF